MACLLIVGYGNSLRGDDAVGRLAAERLRAILQDSEVEVLPLAQLTPELMESLSRVERAIFIDASEEGRPGEIRWRKLEPAVAAPGNFTHHVTPEALLAGARLLYGRAPEALLCTVTGQRFGLGEELSAPVREALEKLVTSRLPWPS